MRRILVAVDWSDASDIALRRATQLARADKAALHILHVVPRSADSADFHAAQARIRAHECDERFEHARCGGVSSAVRSGKPAAAILDEARREKADLIVLGRSRRAALGPLFGSIAQQILRASRVPVLIAGDRTTEPYRKLLVAVDSDRTTDELGLAFCLSTAETIHVVHAFHTPFEAFLPREEMLAHLKLEEREDVDRALDEVCDRFPAATVQLLADVEEGEVIPVLARVLRETAPDLLVIGNHGRTGISRLLHGSFAEAIVESFAVDTLVAAPPRW